MAAIGEDIQRLRSQADAARKLGDGFRRNGQEADAHVSFNAALQQLQRCLDMLDQAECQQDPDLANVRVDVLGVCAGILRRMDRQVDAYERYAEGARLERQFSMAGTYCRVNELTFALIANVATLAEIQDRTREVADLLHRTLSDPATQRDNAWLLGDLGDCRGLLGELVEAERAYKTFIAMADPKAPEFTLAVLDQISTALERAGDPDRHRLTAMIAALRAQMRTPPQAGAR